MMKRFFLVTLLLVLFTAVSAMADEIKYIDDINPYFIKIPIHSNVVSQDDVDARIQIVKNENNYRCTTVYVLTNHSDRVLKYMFKCGEDISETYSNNILPGETIISVFRSIPNTVDLEHIDELCYFQIDEFQMSDYLEMGDWYTEEHYQETYEYRTYLSKIKVAGFNCTEEYDLRKVYLKLEDQEGREITDKETISIQSTQPCVIWLDADGNLASMASLNQDENGIYITDSYRKEATMFFMATEHGTIY